MCNFFFECAHPPFSSWVRHCREPPQDGPLIPPGRAPLTMRAIGKPNARPWCMGVLVIISLVRVFSLLFFTYLLTAPNIVLCTVGLRFTNLQYIFAKSKTANSLCVALQNQDRINSLWGNMLHTPDAHAFPLR